MLPGGTWRNAKAQARKKDVTIPYNITYMWNLKYGTNQHIYGTETDSQIEELPVVEEGRRGKECEFWISRGKLLHIGWINSKVLLYRTRDYIQYPVTNHNGKEHEKLYIYICVYIYIYHMCVYIYIYLSYFAVQKKLIQHCKSTTLQ